MMTKGRVDRTGVIHFGDASISVWEEGLGGDWDQRQRWDRAFKRQVFARIVQTLNRLGWKVAPQHYIFTNDDNRFCQKGDLKGDLQMSGRSIKFEMFQSVNCPKRKDHEGRYEWDKEAVMPYPLRLEMERTRRRIRDYLTNVFTGYTFRPPKVDYRAGLTFIMQERADLNAFQGGRFYDKPPESYNSTSATGGRIAHEDRVYFRENGRLLTGIAYHHINNMWWVLCPGGVVRNVSSSSLQHHADVRDVAIRGRWFPEREVMKRLAAVKAKAIECEAFERAAAVRDVLRSKLRLAEATPA